jgi:hypothetical protein
MLLFYTKIAKKTSEKMPKTVANFSQKKGDNENSAECGLPGAFHGACCAILISFFCSYATRRAPSAIFPWFQLEP